MYARERTQCLSRPSGTDGVSRSRQPSDKSLGYCQVSLRDKGTDNVFIHNTLCHQRPPRLVPSGLSPLFRNSVGLIVFHLWNRS